MREKKRVPGPFPFSLNPILLAKIDVDTAENKPLKVHLIFKLWDLIFTEPTRPYYARVGLPIASIRSGAKELMEY